MFNNTHGKDIAMHSAKGCCTATTMALTSIKQKFLKSKFLILEWRTVKELKIFTVFICQLSKSLTC